MLSFFLNIPYTIIGIIAGLFSIPTSIAFKTHPYAVIFRVKSFALLLGHQKARAMTIGHIILLSPKILKNDFEHELIHVKQYEREPFIYPFLYYYQMFKNGYRKNKYEDEAYRISRSIYRGKQS